MKTAVWSIAAVVLLLTAMAFLRKRDDRIHLSDFTWKVSGKTAPFSFRVSNLIDESITVVLIAEAFHLTHDDTRVSELSIGVRKVEVPLGPRESRSVKGEILLSRFGSSETRVSYYLSIKEPNKALEPTRTSGTSAAKQPLVPAVRVAHL